jgi:exopolyphosphatase / guanosine-5'-triphosphate,3'-diphosphate pyrophosphatase
VPNRSPASQGAGRRVGKGGRSAQGGDCAPAQTYAAIDLGTNNCRLLIAEPRDTGFHVVDAFSRIVRLGEGVDSSGVLSDAAIDRTVSALRVCAGKMRSSRVARTRTVATEACRRAANGQGFLERVARETGIELEIIDPGEEAGLALAGCTPLIDPECRHALVFDIGGGSTELIWVEIVPGDDPRVIGWTSLSCGVVTLTERHGGDEISSATYEDMVQFVTGLLHEFEAEHNIREAIRTDKAHLLGTSGTVTTLAAVHLELPRYDRSKVDGTWIDVASLGAVAGRLKNMSFEQRAQNPCIRRARADLVVAGCAIMDAITGMWNMQRLRVADRGLREGMLTQMMSADRREKAGTL